MSPATANRRTRVRQSWYSATPILCRSLPPAAPCTGAGLFCRLNAARTSHRDPSESECNRHETGRRSPVSSPGRWNRQVFAMRVIGHRLFVPGESPQRARRSTGFAWKYLRQFPPWTTFRVALSPAKQTLAEIVEPRLGTNEHVYDSVHSVVAKANGFRVTREKGGILNNRQRIP